MQNGTFELGSVVHVDNKMQTGYSYVLSEPQGAMPRNFQPAFTPGQMLRLGVFEGKYLRDCADEYPREMFRGARFADAGPDPTGCNAFKAKSRNPTSYWLQQGWIHPQDPRGWFEWFCRFWLGRRTEDDARQIARWQRFAPRHAGAVRVFGNGDIRQRKATRQALLQWSHDPVVDFVNSEGETVFWKTCRALGVNARVCY
jgi:hypothetical protein